MVSTMRRQDITVKNTFVHIPPSESCQNEHECASSAPAHSLFLQDELDLTFQWRVEAGKLERAPWFKLILNPAGDSNFRRAKRQGFVQLKCEEELYGVEDATLEFSIAVGRQMRGPIAHEGQFIVQRKCEDVRNLRAMQSKASQKSSRHGAAPGRRMKCLAR